MSSVMCGCDRADAYIRQKIWNLLNIKRCEPLTHSPEYIKFVEDHNINVEQLQSIEELRQRILSVSPLLDCTDDELPMEVWTLDYLEYHEKWLERMAEAAEQYQEELHVFY